MDKKKLLIDEYIQKEDGYFFIAEGQSRKERQNEIEAFFGKGVLGNGDAKTDEDTEDDEFVIYYREGYDGCYETGTFSFEKSEDILEHLIENSVYKTITARKTEAELIKSSISISFEEFLQEKNIQFKSDWFKMD